MKIGDTIEIEGKGTFEIRDVGGPSLSDYVPVLHQVQKKLGLDKAWEVYCISREIDWKVSPISFGCFKEGAHALLKYAEAQSFNYNANLPLLVKLDDLKKWCGK